MLFNHHISLHACVCVCVCGLFLVCGFLTLSFKFPQTVHLLKSTQRPSTPFPLLQSNQTRFHLVSFITPKMRQHYVSPGTSLRFPLDQSTQCLLAILTLPSVEITFQHDLIDCKVYLIFSFAFKVIFRSPSSF